jgi:hypothetical protein
MAGKKLRREDREALVRHAEDVTGWQVRDTHINSIVVNNPPRGITNVRIAEGDRLSPPLSDTPNEVVLAILESNAYLVVTPTRGGVRGAPYLYGASEVAEVEHRRES